MVFYFLSYGLPAHIYTRLKEESWGMESWGMEGKAVLRRTFWHYEAIFLSQLFAGAPRL